MAAVSGQYQRLRAASLVGVNMPGMGTSRTNPVIRTVPGSCPSGRVDGVLRESGTHPRLIHTSWPEVVSRGVNTCQPRPAGVGA